MTSPNDLSPVFDHPSTGPESAQTDPGRSADSYFPRSHRSSFSSNSSSVVAEPNNSSNAAFRTQPIEPPSVRPAQPTRAHTTVASVSSSSSAAAVRKVDALSRDFPKPDREATLEEMLARPPQKWSVGHYVKNARDAKAPLQDKERQAREFAEAKRQLLAAKEALERSVSGGR